MRPRRTSLAPIAVTCLVACLAAAGCSGSTSPGTTTRYKSAATPAGAWLQPNGNLANTRVAAGSVISSANVASLREAWTFKLNGLAAAGVASTGAFAANPVVAGGMVYIQDLDANVYALSLATGKLKWEYAVNTAEKSGPGPDGVAVANGVVYGDTPTTVFGLNASTGKAVWVDKSLLSKGQGSFEIQPAAANGTVYLASAYGSGPGGGVLFALNAATGKVIWRFNTLLGQDPGVHSIGLGSGGAWETPLVGTDGAVTFGIGNPYQSAASALSQPSAQLYTDSDVNIDAATGKLRWYYQGVTNDFKDYDMQASPIAATIGGAPAVIGGGKMGIVYAMNAATGKLIWKTPVGVHDGHDSDSLLALEHKLALKAPYSFEPGSLGGVLSNMALAGNTVYVATIDWPFKVKSMSLPLGTPYGPATGEIVALNVNNGKVEWDTRLTQMPLGAMTVSNDLVFTTLFGGELIALNRNTGAVVYRHALPTSANAPIAIAGNAVIVPAGGPRTLTSSGGNSQLVVYTVRPNARTQAAIRRDHSQPMPGQHGLTAVAVRSKVLSFAAAMGAGARILSLHLMTLSAARTQTNGAIPRPRFGRASKVWLAWLRGPWRVLNCITATACPVKPNAVYAIAVDARTGAIAGMLVRRPAS